jgi:hypothetical protein
MIVTFCKFIVGAVHPLAAPWLRVCLIGAVVGKGMDTFC